MTVIKKIAILGFAREGKSLLKFLKKSKQFRNVTIEILDKDLDNNYLKNLNGFDMIFRSPGVPYNLPEIQKAVKNGVNFSSSTKLFFELCQSPIIGITGTKGKGTTSTLLYQILKNSGKKAWLAGNIGKPAIEILSKIKKTDWIILELSSFQLQDLIKPAHYPKIAVILDIFDDHLDVHKNFKEYTEAKSNLVKLQRPADIIFYFKDNEWSKKIAQKSRGVKIGIDGKPFGLKKNFVIAAAVAAYLGCPNDVIIKTIKKFKGLEHRLELVSNIKVGHKKEIRIYNDSAATNPMTTVAAIDNFQGQPLILIAGGKDKNLDYKPLAERIKKFDLLRLVILFGENKEKIKQALQKNKDKELKIIEAKKIETVVKTAYQEAKKLINSSTHQLATILFSPASASFDMFKDYADRGRQFKKIVKKIKIR